MKTITIDLDDFSTQNNNLFFVDKLRQQYPNFKISMFYVPADTQYTFHVQEMNEEAKNLIRKAVNEGWLELIPHGLMHLPNEFENISYTDMEFMLKAYEEHFTKDLQLPYVKGFKAPYWLYSKDVVKCLDDNGWWMAVDRNQPKVLKTKRYYEYNWSIEEPFPKDKDRVLGHGHISEPSANAITRCFINLTRIPSDYEFRFVSEVMKDGDNHE